MIGCIRIEANNHSDMNGIMYQEERHAAILERARSDGRVDVTDAGDVLISDDGLDAAVAVDLQAAGPRVVLA